MAGLGEEVELNKKHIWIRIMLFVIVLSLAAGGFGYGIYAWINGVRTKPGLYTITFTQDSTYGPFQSNVALIYNVEDTEKENAGTMYNNLIKLGSEKAKKIYILLNSKKSYKSGDVYLINNLYTLNDRINEEIEIDKLLYDVLEDANLKNKTYDSYNLFSGLLNYSWESFLTDEQLDPIKDDNSKNAIKEAVRLSNKENYSLDLTKKVDDSGLTKYYAKFNVSSNVVDELNNPQHPLSFIKESVGVYPILDLNILFDSYYLENLKNEFVNNGYSNGILTTYTGPSISLGGNNVKSSYPFYTNKEDQVYSLGNIVENGEFACSSIRYFPAYEYESQWAFNYFKIGNTTYSHNLYYDYRTGYSNEGDIYSSTLLSKNKKLSDLVMEHLDIVLTKEDYLDKYKSSGDKYIYILKSDLKKVTANKDVMNGFQKSVEADKYTWNIIN